MRNSQQPVVELTVASTCLEWPRCTWCDEHNSDRTRGRKLITQGVELVPGARIHPQCRDCGQRYALFLATT